jgi:CHAT domain-containing protein/Tfp pilus assembly protein PilF
VTNPSTLPRPSRRLFRSCFLVLAVLAILAGSDLRAAAAPQDPASRLDPKQRAEELVAVGDQKRSRGAFQEAIEDYRAALRLLPEYDLASRGNVFFRIGSSLYYIGDLNGAEGAYEEGLALTARTEDSSLKAQILNGLAALDQARGESGMALDRASQALQLVREDAARRVDAGYARMVEAAILNTLGAIYRRRGELQEALEAFRRCRTINRELQNRRDEVKVLAHLGAIHADLGDWSLALENFRDALDFRGSSEPFWEATTRSQLGQVHFRLGDLAEAEIQFEEALALNFEGPRPEAVALHGLGVVRRELGQPAEARKFLKVALDRRLEEGDRLGQALTYLELAATERDLGDGRAALGSLRCAGDLARETEAPMVEAEVLLRTAEIERDRGDLRAARASAGRALDIVESLRASVVSEGLRASFLASRRSHSELLIDLLLRLAEREPGGGHAAEALQVSERSRARGLLDLLAEAEIDVKRGISPELKQEETELAAELNNVQSGLLKELSQGSPNETIVASLREKMLRLDGRRQALEERIRREHPRYAEVRYPEPLPASRIQHLLNGDTVLLEYFLGEEIAVVWAVTRERVEARRLARSSSEIAVLVEQVRRGLERSSASTLRVFKRAARELSEILLAPVEDVLGETERLLIAPDGALYYLAFEVLLTKNPASLPLADLPYLLQRATVTYVPSASVLDQLAGPGQAPEDGERLDFVAYADPLTHGGAPAGDPVRSGLLGERRLALPSLEGTREEVTRIAKLYPEDRVMLYLGSDATEENVGGNPDLARARRVHIATHGLIDEEQPGLSSLFLSRGAGSDGLLQVHEIFDLELSADLVVLSACNTALGRQVRGEGLVGLSRAFLYAGTSSLVVSLWPVTDSAAPDVMVPFYRNLDAGDDKAEALRRAKLDALRGGRSHPHYWAPFILVGRPDPIAPSPVTSRGSKSPRIR